MRQTLLHLLVVACLSLSFPVQSQPEGELSAVALSPEWLALLHFQRDAARSYVDDPRFFLSPQGDNDPAAELRASVQRLRDEPQLRCRFIARYQWLAAADLLAAQPEDLQHCEDYWQWRAELNIESVVLVFAASYLNSPSSMYGHTFLRLDPRGARADSPLLSYALNFAANVPPRDNSLLFAYRGLAGGYPGLFSLQPYYQKVQEYSRLENRDMWEYRLNLSGPEINRLLAHVWELQGINFDYYFIDENCSYRLLELLEVARPGLDLTSEFAVHAIPVDTVRAVSEAGLIGAVDYRPSRQVELQYLLDQLPVDRHPFVLQLAGDPSIADSPDFQSLPRDQQRLIVLAAYRYLRYRHNREVRDVATAGNSLSLLRLLRHYPQRDETPARPAQPDQGHPTSLLALAAGDEEGQLYADVEWRLSYHDLLDPVAGYPTGASLNMGRLVLRAQQEKSPQLQRFDVVEISSLAPRTRFFRPLSWRVNFGVERQFVDQEDPLVWQLNGGVGRTWQLGGWSPWLLATARLEYNDAFERHWQLAPGIAGGLHWQRSWGGLLLSADRQDFSGGAERFQYRLSLQKHLGSAQGLRLSLLHREHDGEERSSAKLMWRRYF